MVPDGAQLAAVPTANEIVVSRVRIEGVARKIRSLRRCECCCEQNCCDREAAMKSRHDEWLDTGGDSFGLLTLCGKRVVFVGGHYGALVVENLPAGGGSLPEGGAAG